MEHKGIRIYESQMLELPTETIQELIKDEEEAVAGYKSALNKTTKGIEIQVLTHILNEELEHIEELKQILKDRGIEV